MSSPNSVAPAAAKDQYHHYIPRFILRFFQVRSNRSKAQRKRKSGEAVLFYNLVTRALETRLIRDVYGVQNLYRDVKNILDMNELEAKLALLEKDAAKVINDLHDARTRGIFCLKRRSLDRLRKFLFVMHYRHNVLPETYFGNDPHTREWTKSFSRKHGLRTSTEVWLFGLRYYLDTPHQQIALHGAEIQRKYGRVKIQQMLEISQIDPDMEHYLALAYVNQAESYFLCFWEAAEGEEFVLGDNGFGLWEGCAAGDIGLHRMFVVSPRIAVVLRGCEMRPEMLSLTSQFLITKFGDVQQAPPTPTYADGTHTLKGGSKELARYRLSSQAEEDIFTFKITSLTQSQTFALNSVILQHVPDKGSITFSSSECMLRTARTYCQSPLNFPNRLEYLPLVHHLSNLNSIPSATPDPVIIAANTTIAQTPSDIKLFEMITNIQLKFRSHYNRAVTVLSLVKERRLLGHDSLSRFAASHHTMLSMVISSYKDIIQPPSAERSRVQVSLPSSLSQTMSEQLFTALRPIMESMGSRCSSADFIDGLQHEVVAVAFLTWAAQDAGIFMGLTRSIPVLLVALSQPEKIVDLHDEDETAVDQTLRETIIDICTCSTTFSSRYDRAYCLFQLCNINTDSKSSFTAGYNKLISTATTKFTNLMKLPPPGFSPKHDAQLVESLPDEQSDFVLAVMDELMKMMGWQRKDSFVEMLMRETVGVGFLLWLAQNRHDHLAHLLPGLQIVKVPDREVYTIDLDGIPGWTTSTPVYGLLLYMLPRLGHVLFCGAFFLTVLYFLCHI